MESRGTYEPSCCVTPSAPHFPHCRSGTSSRDEDSSEVSISSSKTTYTSHAHLAEIAVLIRLPEPDLGSQARKEMVEVNTSEASGYVLLLPMANRIITAIKTWVL